MMSEIRSKQLVDEIVEEDEVVLLYKEGCAFHRVGLGGINPHLVGILVGIVETARERPGDRLSGGELQVLERYPSAATEEVSRALARSAGIRQRILDTSLSVGQAAERLGVGTSRIRQRIGEGSLYAIKVGRSWRLPDWHFTKSGELPGIAAVIHALPDGTDLLEVDGFVTSSNVDLVVEDVAVTPLEWLGAGLDAESVLRIAADL
jgi:excisionase family DNA binding protein